MNGKGCRHAYPNNDGDCWCSLLHEDFIEERRICHGCNRREAQCIKQHISGHARSVARISIQVNGVTVKIA